MSLTLAFYFWPDDRPPISHSLMIPPTFLTQPSMQLTPLGGVVSPETGELCLKSLFGSIMTPNRSCLALMENLGGAGGASGGGGEGGWKALVGAGLLGRARICRMPPQSNSHYQVRG